MFVTLYGVSLACIKPVSFFGPNGKNHLNIKCLCSKPIKSLIQGFLPGIMLKIFLMLLPRLLMLMSKFEGYFSISRLERRSASRYYLFKIVNVFLGSIITGAAFEQLNTFLHQSANRYVNMDPTFQLNYLIFFVLQFFFHGWCLGFRRRLESRFR